MIQENEMRTHPNREFCLSYKHAKLLNIEAEWKTWELTIDIIKKEKIPSKLVKVFITKRLPQIEGRYAVVTKKMNFETQNFYPVKWSRDAWTEDILYWYDSAEIFEEDHVMPTQQN